jgi:hypothetical protein
MPAAACSCSISSCGAPCTRIKSESRISPNDHEQEHEEEGEGTPPGCGVDSTPSRAQTRLRKRITNEEINLCSFSMLRCRGLGGGEISQ